MRDGSTWRIRFREAVRAQEAQDFFVSFDSAREHHLILACTATYAVDEMVDLVDQRVDQRMHFGGEVVDQLTQRGVFRLGDRRCELTDGLFAVIADVVSAADLLFERGGESENGVGIAAEEVRLLVFEETEQSSVFLQFVAQAFSDKFPGGTHSDLEDEVKGFKSALEERGAAVADSAGPVRAVNSFSSMRPRPRPPAFERLSARTSVNMCA